MSGDAGVRSMKVGADTMVTLELSGSRLEEAQLLDVCPGCFENIVRQLFGQIGVATRGRVDRGEVEIHELPTIVTFDVVLAALKVYRAGQLPRWGHSQGHGAPEASPSDAEQEAVLAEQGGGQVPDDGLIHGPELDRAMVDAAAPGSMGICITALESRRQAFADDQLSTGAQEIDAVIRAEMPEGTEEAIQLAGLRQAIMASFTYGIAVGQSLGARADGHS